MIPHARQRLLGMVRTLHESQAGVEAGCARSGTQLTPQGLDIFISLDSLLDRGRDSTLTKAKTRLKSLRGRGHFIHPIMRPFFDIPWLGNGLPHVALWGKVCQPRQPRLRGFDQGRLKRPSQARQGPVRGSGANCRPACDGDCVKDNHHR
jgi:hypothetical protein